uniref:Uncharacterized protein n=1 Tax=Rhizophora mucronata TaxID=61149 RepID=A0A2P2ME39_RHIMU
MDVHIQHFISFPVVLRHFVVESSSSYKNSLQ